MSDFRMPSLGADMESGTVYDWRVKPGDAINRGDVIVTVETDKGVIDVEIFETGIVTDIFVGEGTEVPVGTILALINGTGNEKLTEEVANAASADRSFKPEPVDAHPMDQRPLVEDSAAVSAPEAERRLHVSPAARRRAHELGVELSDVKRTGPGGSIRLADVERASRSSAAVGRARVTPLARRIANELAVPIEKVKGTGSGGSITRADVEAAASALPPAQPKPVVTTKPSFQAGMRRAIAAAMSRSNRDIPHYYLESRIDMSAPLEWLRLQNGQRSLKERILPAVLFIKATAKALGHVPGLNGYWRNDQFEPQEAIHIGFAIALRQGGLVTPAIHHADILSVDEIMEKLRDLIIRTRGGRLRSSELTDATVTVTSLGDRGAEKVYGVIYPPQVALLGLGKVSDQPWVENGMLGVRPVLSAVLAADHRASDGHTGTLFLESFNDHLQNPEKLL